MRGVILEHSWGILVGDDLAQRDKSLRILLLAAWLALVLWLLWGHVFWRDEVRGYSLALSGTNVTDMLRNIHGEGHPALWYLILRGAHTLFPYRGVLPVMAAVIGIAAITIFALYSPFRLPIVVMVLFSAYGAFEYVVVARNYGIAALVMFVLAASYGRIKNSLWFGGLLSILCNTNVPSCILAAAFLLFRYIEMLTDRKISNKRDWLIFGGNALAAAVGAALAFITVYPTPNDAAVSPNLSHINASGVIAALLDTHWGFSHLFYLGAIPLAISCLAFIGRPAAFCAAIAAFVALKFFFFFVYESYYRHEILYLVFLISLAWMTANGAGGGWRQKPWVRYPQFLGTSAFIGVLAFQMILLGEPLLQRLRGVPYSHSAGVAKLLRKPALSRAIIMADPDLMLEPLPYYVDNPLWFLRQQRFGKVVSLSENARRRLSLDDILSDADRLHRATGRPVVFLSQPELQEDHDLQQIAMFDDETISSREGVNHFLSSTRLIARFRTPNASNEDYDVYVYPR